MQEYVIDVTQVENYQTLNDLHELEKIFSKAQSTIVNGEKVVIVRKSPGAPPQKFDELTTLEELKTYRKQVFKYLH